MTNPGDALSELLNEIELIKETLRMQANEGRKLLADGMQVCPLSNLDFPLASILKELSQLHVSTCEMCEGHCLFPNWPDIPTIPRSFAVVCCEVQVTGVPVPGCGPWIA